MSDNTFSFVGGLAGSGKTYWAREQLRNHSLDTKLTATTGIAAINCSDDQFTCTTINSLLWYKDTKALEDAEIQGRLAIALKRVSDMGIKHVLVDEASMMSGRQLDIICRAIDRINRYSYDAPIRLTIVGDFLQLPPVAQATEGFAFEGECWPRFEENTTILTEIKRQADAKFIEALRAVRRGDGEEAVEFFSDYMTPVIDVDFEGQTIFGYNNEVDRFNKLRLARLDTQIVRFPSHRFDTQLSEWRNNIPEIFETKIDSLVMVLVNKAIPYSGGQFEYVNGDLGYLRVANKDHAVVELIRTKNTVEIEYTKKENIKKVNGRNIVVGTCEHIPLRVAYATSCHKSQSLSLDRVQVNINTKFFKEPALTYVALSRARTPEGLRIISGSKKTFVSRCKTSPKVERWL